MKTLLTKEDVKDLFSKCKGKYNEHDVINYVRSLHNINIATSQSIDNATGFKYLFRYSKHDADILYNALITTMKNLSKVDLNKSGKIKNKEVTLFSNQRDYTLQELLEFDLFEYEINNFVSKEYNHSIVIDCVFEFVKNKNTAIKDKNSLLKELTKLSENVSVLNKLVHKYLFNHFTFFTVLDCYNNIISLSTFNYFFHKFIKFGKYSSESLEENIIYSNIIDEDSIKILADEKKSIVSRYVHNQIEKNPTADLSHLYLLRA